MGEEWKWRRVRICGEKHAGWENRVGAHLLQGHGHVCGHSHTLQCARRQRAINIVVAQDLREEGLGQVLLAVGKAIDAFRLLKLNVHARYHKTTHTVLGQAEREGHLE